MGSRLIVHCTKYYHSFFVQCNKNCQNVIKVQCFRVAFPDDGRGRLDQRLIVLLLSVQRPVVLDQYLEFALAVARSKMQQAYWKALQSADTEKARWAGPLQCRHGRKLPTPP